MRESSGCYEIVSTKPHYYSEPGMLAAENKSDSTNNKSPRADFVVDKVSWIISSFLIAVDLVSVYTSHSNKTKLWHH